MNSFSREVICCLAPVHVFGPVLVLILEHLRTAPRVSTICLNIAEGEIAKQVGGYTAVLGTGQPYSADQTMARDTVKAAAWPRALQGLRPLAAR